MLARYVARRSVPLSRAFSQSTFRLDTPESPSPKPPANSLADYTPNTATGSPLTIPNKNTPTGSLVAQSPNYATTWSPSQLPRNLAFTGARFEQTLLEYQPKPESAMEMISQVPVIMVHGRKAVCDGGGGALGHPKVYINLDQPGPRSCGYCGVRYEQEHSDAHH
ncbi:NADH:ubiquinone oxidoreductase, NDUFS6/13 kDa subunit [Phaffia rhodozyma]|uniref:NADH:ubiquinone oxidoreductase, NDUFS6/13 kDa subunit n=1 Tax=Phaffia rhodozyma TaxID=264483 RepID=A0A0F7SXE3_PHARH|nr:NADH:ubiquinone oxidoreductase, NDUFS6/13 kDa subunit [Phaffia rhodozyma]